jgi:hypothetical protein
MSVGSFFFKCYWQGDNGGPIVVQATAGSTSWTQVGVVSYGIGIKAYKRLKVSIIFHFLLLATVCVPYAIAYSLKRVVSFS